MNCWPTIWSGQVKSFLGNLAVRSDNSVLVNSMNARKLFYIRPSSGDAPIEPVLLHRFDQPTTGLVEIEPDLLLVSTSNIHRTHESLVHRIDLPGFQAGSSVQPEMVFRFPDTARGLNGSCLIAPGAVLIAGCFAGLVWRVDVHPGGRDIQARVWLAHETMGYFPGNLKPEQPGVNGVRYAARTHHRYYTATAKKLLMRVPVDPGDNSGFPQSVMGDPSTEALIGPCSVAWGRGPGDYGKVAYVISDGGTASPAPGGPLPARLQRVEFQHGPGQRDGARGTGSPHTEISVDARP